MGLWPHLTAPYSIPFEARRVIKFDPVSKSTTHIGPDFGENRYKKWYTGAITGSGIIYCLPKFYGRGILKIDTNTDTVTELDRNLFQKMVIICGDHVLSCAAALDGCIYFMPCRARRIIKLDPNNNYAISSVGDDLGRGLKYIGTVVGIDGCVYGIPSDSFQTYLETRSNQ